MQSKELRRSRSSLSLMPECNLRLCRCSNWFWCHILMNNARVGRFIDLQSMVTCVEARICAHKCRIFADSVSLKEFV